MANTPKRRISAAATNRRQTNNSAKSPVVPKPAGKSAASSPAKSGAHSAANSGAKTDAKIGAKSGAKIGANATDTATARHKLRGLHTPDPHEWIKKESVRNTSDVPLPELLIDEVIGQDEAVATAKKAARQRRHLLMLGDPGTGKSMIAKAMAQILPPTHLDDVLVYSNPKDENLPRVKTIKGGMGRRIFNEKRKEAKRRTLLFAIVEWVLALSLVGGGVAAFFVMGGFQGSMVLLMTALIAIFFMSVSRQNKAKAARDVPNLLIERPSKKLPAPYVDATGSHDGALLGDIRHDPFQSGGMETPTHLRVEPGFIHRAHKGLLFIDEINVLRLKSQQALLTAMQEKEYSITGQSERSSGAMAKTGKIPCDFILVAAGNMDVIDPSQQGEHVGLHPALRSRIRGYGYEVYVRSVMDDTDENRRKLVRFVAQEVRRDGQIPHFDGAAVAEVLREAQRRSAHTGKLTLRLRELGGLVRTAGDLARDDNRGTVTVEDVLTAKHMSMSLEYQVTRRGIEVTTAKEAMDTTGSIIGACTGTAYMGTGETGEPAGLVVPIEADCTSSIHQHRGEILVGGGLQKDSSIKDNTSALLKRLAGDTMMGRDIHIQGLMENIGATITSTGAAAAIAAVSALEQVPVRRDTVVIGALAVSGRLRGVEGVTQMIEGAADLGYTRAVVPRANQHDILLEHSYRDKIEIIFAADIGEAMSHALATGAPKILKALKR